MRKYFLGILVAISVLAACEVTGSKEIPAKQKDAITKLRDRNIELNHERAELQRKMVEIDAECQYNATQMTVVATEALNVMGISASDWTINIDTLKIDKRVKK